VESSGRNNKKIDYIHWNNHNELVDRLQLLKALC